MKSELEIRRAAGQALKTLDAISRGPSTPESERIRAMLLGVVGMAHWTLEMPTDAATAVGEFLDTAGTAIQRDSERN